MFERRPDDDVSGRPSARSPLERSGGSARARAAGAATVAASPAEADLQAIRPAAMLAGALFVVVAARAAFLRYFVNDDYQMLYTAWLRALGRVAPRDFALQSFHVLPDAIALGFRLAGDRLAVAWGTRLVLVAFSVGAAVAAAGVARRVVSPAAAPYAFVYALFTWGMLVRGGDIRPDVISALLWLCLAAWMASRVDGRRAFWMGALLGLALVVRFKAVVLAPGLAAGLLLAAWRARPRAGRALLALSLAAGGGIAAALALFTLFLTATGQVDAFLVGTRTVGAVAAGVSEVAAHNVRTGTLVSALSHDGWFAVAVVAGSSIALFRAPARPGELTVAAGALLSAAALLVWANPAFYSYGLATLGPLLAPLAAGAPVALLAYLARRGASARVQAITGVALLLFPVAWHAPLLHELATRPTNARQLALHEWLERTPPDTVVFALEGLGLFRPSVRDWRLAQISLPLYRRGDIALGAQLDDARPEVFLMNYRVPAWLRPDDQARVLERSVEIAPDVRVLGAVAHEGAPALLVNQRKRRFTAEGRCVVDGVPRAPGAPFELSPGEHRVEGGCSVRLDVRPPPGAGLPYLLSPDGAVYRSR